MVNKKLTVSDFEKAFSEPLTDFVKSCISNYAFDYEEFTVEEKDGLIKIIVQTLLNPNVERSGEHRIDQWESGWGENLEEFIANPTNIDKIIPRYFNKYGAVRWLGSLIKPKSEKFEYYSLVTILDWLFDKYLRNANAIYEFGCGTGHNLLHTRKFNKDAKLFGLDWATTSQELINKMRETGVDKNLFGYNFDYFNPNYEIDLEPNSVIYTVASLEQIGSKWDNFVSYLIDKKPRLCIHVEPIGELLDDEVLLDYLSVKYFEKRNYLNGYLNGLRKLETEGKIKIHKQQRTHIGSLFIEGYSVVVWEPIY